MKIFEVAIQKIRKPNRTDFVWPEWWGDVVGSVDVVAYEDEGKVREGAICVCSNSTWESILLKHDKSITARTVTEANIKGRKWKPQREVVTDQGAAIMAMVKVSNGDKLTSTEASAIDPDDPTPGIGKTKLFDINDIIKEK